MSPKHWRPATLAATLGRGPFIGTTLAVTVVWSVLFGIWLSLVDATMLHVIESQMAFTVDRFVAAIGPLGPAGISEVIRLVITLDFVYPVAYGMSLGGIWARLAGPSAWGTPALPLAAALGAAAADWIENTFHLAAAAQMVGGTRPSALLVAAGSMAATIKWTLLVGALLATARAAALRRGRMVLVAIPTALLAGALAAAVLAATI